MTGIEEGRVDVPRVCEGCYMPFGDFVETYYEDCKTLIKLLVKHGLLPEKKAVLSVRWNANWIYVVKKRLYVFITEAVKPYPPLSP